MQPDYIDLYCERTDPEFWNEPLNTKTNLAFILAGLLLVVALRRAAPKVRRDPAILLLGRSEMKGSRMRFQLIEQAPSRRPSMALWSADRAIRRSRHR